MRGRLAAVAAVATAVLAGCTATEDGNPSAAPGTGSAGPTTSTTDDPTTSAPGADVPRVKTPLDVSKFVDKPCTALTQAQLDRLGVADQQQGTEPTGQYCRWSNDRGGYVNLAFVAGQGGLSAVYGGSEAGQYKLFEELPEVAGYPAVIAMLTDERKPGDCGIAIGVDDDITLSVGTAQSLEKVGTGDPCQVAVGVAEQILETVKAGG